MKQTGMTKDLARQEPNTTGYLEHRGKHAIYVFFTKSELETLAAVAGRTSIPKWIRDLVLSETTLLGADEDV